MIRCFPSCERAGLAGVVGAFDCRVVLAFNWLGLTDVRLGEPAQRGHCNMVYGTGKRAPTTGIVGVSRIFLSLFGRLRGPACTWASSLLFDIGFQTEA